MDLLWLPFVLEMGGENMISENSLRQISDIFCGDTGDFYSYKTGSKLVGFFNQYFQAKDAYGFRYEDYLDEDGEYEEYDEFEEETIEE